MKWSNVWFWFCIASALTGVAFFIAKLFFGLSLSWWIGFGLLAPSVFSVLFFLIIIGLFLLFSSGGGGAGGWM